jgi:hypothetical protein
MLDDREAVVLGASLPRAESASQSSSTEAGRTLRSAMCRIVHGRRLKESRTISIATRVNVQIRAIMFHNIVAVDIVYLNVQEGGVLLSLR